MLKLFVFVFCAVFIGVNGYKICEYDKIQNKVGKDYIGMGDEVDDYDRTDYKEMDSDEIVGGNEVEIEEYPHQVSVFLADYSSDSTWCGGSIISEQYILTAAHCVKKDLNPKKYSIRAGSKYNNKGGMLYYVNLVKVHPQFEYIKPDYDAAILRTTGRIAINGHTTKIVKLPSSDTPNLSPGTLVTVTGWGQKDDGKASSVLLAVSLPVVDRAQCRKAWNQQGQKITKRMLCAGYDKPGKSACHGDSGGPLVTENDVIQYGIVSLGSPNCDNGVPNVYTSVVAIRDWIKQISGV